MKILFILYDIRLLGFANKLNQSTHSVKVYFENPGMAGIGCVSMVDSWVPNVQWADFIITDMPTFIDKAEYFEEKGTPIYGINIIESMLPKDKEKEYELMRKCGYKDIPSLKRYMNKDEFDSCSRPKENVIVRAHGKTISVEKYEIINWLLKTVDDSFTVQLMQPGIKFTLVQWFNGFTAVGDSYVVLPGKGGCVGVKSKELKLNEKLLKALKNAKYFGPVAIKCVAHDKLYYTGIDVGLSSCYDLFPEGLKTDFGMLLHDACKGRKPNIAFTDDYLISVDLSSRSKVHSSPILGINRNNEKHLLLYGCYKQGDGYLTSGEELILRATARGRSIRECERRVTRTLENIDVFGKFVGEPISSNTLEDIAELKEMGWL